MSRWKGEREGKKETECKWLKWKEKHRQNARMSTATVNGIGRNPTHAFFSLLLQLLHPVNTVKFRR